MIKLAILGSENSHCWSFASVLAPLDGNKIYKDIELLGVYGEPGEPGVTEGNEQIAKMSACRSFAEDKDAFLEEADAVMVTARNGGKHLKYAESYIKKGIPVWIDKPTTCSVGEAVEMLRLAEKHGAVLSGGSSLEFHSAVKKYAELAKEKREEITGAHITAPVSMDNPYGGFWFYTQHLAAMIIKIFGTEIRAVRAVKTDKGVNAVYEYDNFSVSAFYGAGYSITLYTGAYDAEAEAFGLPGDYFMPELDAFYKVIKTGKPDKTKREYIAPVCVLEATVKSYESGQRVEIIYPDIACEGSSAIK